MAEKKKKEEPEKPPVSSGNTNYEVSSGRQATTKKSE